MFKLAALFVVVPLVETYLLFLLGVHLGFWPTVLLVLGTGLLGGALAKREGLKVWHEWQGALARMEMPEEGILGGVLVLVGGVLLVTPGVLTDVLGLSLLIPPSRRWLARPVRAWLKRRFAGASGVHYRVVGLDGSVVEGFRTQVGGTRARVRPEEGVIDTEGEVIDERRRGDEGKEPASIKRLS